MADVKWVKIVTSIFDNRKIRQIEAMPESDSILVIWFKLICLAGTTNDNGMVYFTPEIPYTEEMLATQFNRPLPVVRLALQTFQVFGMVEVVDDFLHLSSWDKYQNTDGMDRIREQNRIRKQRQRERERLELDSGHVTSRDSHAIDKEGDIEEEREKEKGEKEIPVTADEPPAPPQVSVPYESIRNLFNGTCPSLSKCKTMSEARKKAIKARYASGYTLADFKALFEKAEASSFLRGKNARNWVASFDWLIKDANMAKVLDGNYDDKKGGGPDGGSEQHPEKEGQYGTYL